ncbi:MAG: glycosyltransferase family 1 protein [Thermodesulfobacteriota bacterium]
MKFIDRFISMKILFDARVLGGHMHGMARYCAGLLRQLLEGDQGIEYLVLIADLKVRAWFNPTVPVRWIPTTIPLYSLQEQILLPRQIRGESFDLFHSPTYTIPRVLAGKGILTIHDLIPLLFPEDYGRKHRLFFRFVVRKAVARCLRVVTVSKHSSEDLLARYPISGEKVVITPNGLDPHWRPRQRDSAFLEKQGLDNGYVLFVGNPKPHKNFNRVLAAFERLLEEGGYPGNLAAVGVSLRELPPSLKGRVMIFPACNDQDLALFYSGADLLAAPSLYEGFGLPVLEAMACGCPVLIGDRGALPEMAGEAGFQVNPYDIHAIKEGMQGLISNPELRRSLKEKGLARAGDFSWEKTARIVLETYRALGVGRVRP